MNAVAASGIDRDRFAALADALIPGASAVGIAGPLLDRVAAVVPERLAMIRAVTSHTAQAPLAVLDALRTEDSATYDLFCETVAAAYFMAPAVRERIGYPGREPVAARSDAADLADLLLPVLDSGMAPRGMDL